MYIPHTYCRACDYARPAAPGTKSGPGEKLIEVFDLGLQPLANDFQKEGGEISGHAPLKVLYCPRCSLAQLSVVVRPEIMYRNYSYITSTSKMMQDHFQQLIGDIASHTSGRGVLEIGSNDGQLLALLQDKGYSVLGVDPANNLANAARARGVPVQVGFFGEDLARVLPQSDIVIARHVFCHVDDWHDFVKGLEAVSHKDSLICIEVPYVGDLLERCEFDTIYHEHLSYLSLKSVVELLRNSNLRLNKVIRYQIHGGAILLMLRHRDFEPLPYDAFSENLTEEDWRAFAVEARNQIDRLSNTVKSLVAQGKRVAGLGASAKSTVWINACGFTKKEIAFVADNTPQKQYTFSPGTNIPVIDEGAIIRELPDYVVMWAWNYREEILEKFSLARSKGVKFIVPVSKIEVV